MRWKLCILGSVFLIILAAGCAQQSFLFEKDYQQTFQSVGLSPTIEIDPKLGLEVISPDVGAPTTVVDAEREPRFLTLSEAIASALEKGNVGIQSTRSPGTINDDLVTVFPGGTVSLANVDSMRVLAMNPAIAQTAIDAMLSRFDVRWANSITWTHTDEPVQGFNSFANGDTSFLSTSLIKPLPTGGVAGITFDTQYQMLSRPPTTFPVLSPSYQPNLRFTFDHPLWQNFGVATNQLLSRHPGATLGSQLSPVGAAALNSQFNVAGSDGTSGIPSTGILIARTRFDQTRADLERVVSFQLVNVETAYWNLYGAYVNLYAAEQALRQAYAAWSLSKARLDVGRIGPNAYLPTLGQFELFRGDRVQAMDRVLEAERMLRGLMGLPVEDGTRLVPVDTPTLAPYIPDWNSARVEALNNRPELVAARQELKNQQLNLLTLKNFTKPDLRFLSSYSIVGLGSQLDGNSQIQDFSTGTTRSSNALRNLASNHYNDITAGLVLNVPIGYRFENAAIRRARLQLAQGYLSLKNEEEKAERYLTKTYRDLYSAYNQIGARRSQRIAFGKLVDVRLKLFIEGSAEATIDFVLEAQRQWAAALSSEYQAIVAYNNALAAFEFAKGTIMQHDNVVINEGMLPECVKERAVVHERERTKAIILRQRALLPNEPLCTPEQALFHLSQMPTQQAPSIYTLLESSGPLPAELNERPLVRRSTPVTQGHHAVSIPSPTPQFLPPARLGAPVQ